MCFPRSLVCARIYHERGTLRTGVLHDRWNAVRRQNSSFQRELALEITRGAGVTIPTEGCGIREIERFQRYLAPEGIVIIVYRFSTFGRGGLPLYDGSELLVSLGREIVTRLNILYYERTRHFNPILNLRAASGFGNGYCVACNTGFRDVRGHRCVKKCPRCYAAPSCNQLVELVKCYACNRSFFGQSCFARHRAEKSYDGKTPASVCDSVCFCDGCGRFIRRNSKHECGVSYCKSCCATLPENHFCYMRPLRNPAKSSIQNPKPSTSRATEEEGEDAGEGRGGESNENDGNENRTLKPQKNARAAFVFYDFETRQDSSLAGTENIKLHIPTLCIAQQVCIECADENDMTKRCRWCGVREFVFRHDPVKQFVDFATRTTKCFNQIICIAHNAKSFDAQFILRYIVEQNAVTEPKVILNGSKIVVMTVGHTKFIDSINYMPMPLAELPKALGLRGTTVKGMFPHFFNTVDNQAYVGPIPGIEYYAPGSMKTQDRERFLEWHAEQTRQNYVFDFQREIVRYCRTDVEILRQACMAFRKIFLSRGDVCPFEECTTIASTCMKVFRKNFLREKEIGIIPTGGYRRINPHSRKALQWLIWKERELGLRIIHAGHGREYRLNDGTLVDGYFELAETVVNTGEGTGNSNSVNDNNEINNTSSSSNSRGETSVSTTTTTTIQRHVLQFHGCFWHGCPSCHPLNRDKPLNSSSSSSSSSSSNKEDTLESRYERTLSISWRMRKRGYIVTEKWECSFDRDLRENDEMREFLERHPMVESSPLNPRDAFFGGRTGNIATRYKIEGAEKIRYVDVCSLYPYVLKTGAFPLGHPKIYVGEECSAIIGVAPHFDFTSLEGLVRCKVLPPRELFHPVLPYRVRGKLIFALCRSCCETFSQVACTHENPSDREFEGTWVSCELRKAVEKGYLVTSVSEIWQYRVTRFDPATRQGGLFADYINTFLQLKQEASGWPSECVDNGVDEDAKERYLREYEEIEGIALDKHNVARNPGLRSVAKLCLNSFWGKFGQRSNLPTTEVVKSNERFTMLLTSPEHEITDILPVNDEVIYVSWRLREEAIVPSPITNVVIAAYTTAQARLVLYSYLDQLDRRVLYYDTDSCIYVSSGDTDEYEPRTGNFLGDLTDELASYGHGSYIETFVSGGPKFYAFVVRTAEGTRHEVCKVKGISLNFDNSRLVNFHSIENLLLRRERAMQREREGEEEEEEEEETEINLRFRAIRRTVFHEIVTREEKKTCVAVLVKRRFINPRYSVPYGYKET